MTSSVRPSPPEKSVKTTSRVCASKEVRNWDAGTPVQVPSSGVSNSCERPCVGRVSRTMLSSEKRPKCRSHLQHLAGQRAPRARRGAASNQRVTCTAPPLGRGSPDDLERTVLAQTRELPHKREQEAASGNGHKLLSVSAMLLYALSFSMLSLSLSLCKNCLLACRYCPWSKLPVEQGFKFLK